MVVVGYAGKGEVQLEISIMFCSSQGRYLARYGTLISARLAQATATIGQVRVVDIIVG